MSTDKRDTDDVEVKMGCCASQKIHPELIEEKASNEDAISNVEIEIIQSNWKHVENDIQGNGLVLFGRLFEQFPEVQSKFYFTAENNMNLEAIMADEKLAKHAKGVMDTIGIAVGFLQDLPSLSPILNQLGASHAKFLLQDGHFKAIGGCLLWTLEKALGSPLDDATNKAWSKLFSFVTDSMQKGINDSEKQSEKL